MPTTELYYFTGTGNSLAIAQDLATHLNAHLIPIIALKDKPHIHTTADTIGIIFPIYDFQASPLIYQFIQKIDNLPTKYIFAVATYGFYPYKAMKKLKKTLQQQNATLSAGYVIKMPHNGIGIKKIDTKKYQHLYNQWHQNKLHIINTVKNKKTDKLENKNGFVLIILFLTVLPTLIKLMSHIFVTGWKSLGFKANDNCNECRTCEIICPMNNIRIEHHKPCWGDNCITCFACLQWCPKEAIQLGTITTKQPRYHHPQITKNDITNQKNILNKSNN